LLAWKGRELLSGQRIRFASLLVAARRNERGRAVGDEEWRYLAGGRQRQGRIGMSSKRLLIMAAIIDTVAD